MSFLFWWPIFNNIKSKCLHILIDNRARHQRELFWVNGWSLWFSGRSQSQKLSKVLHNCEEGFSSQSWFAILSRKCVWSINWPFCRVILYNSSNKWAHWMKTRVRLPSFVKCKSSEHNYFIVSPSWRFP